MRYVFV